MTGSVALGRVYRCPVCGAEVLVVKASSQALDPHCCNTDMLPLEKVADIYHCKVCGSELAAMRDSGGPMELICCHEPMMKMVAKVPEAA
jgi:DNA-directed RNA polymerase subunit RPC12/RpoP